MIVFSEDKVAYIDAIIESNKTKNTQPFVDFMFDQYNKHLSTLIESVE